MNHSGQTVHPVREDEQSIAYYIVPGDGGDAYLIGEYWQVQQLHEKLALLVEQGVHDGFLPLDDERIAQWLTVREAAELSGLKVRTIHAAVKKGYIKGVLTDPIRFSLRALREYRHGRHSYKKPMTQAQIEQIMRLHKAGMNVSAIASKVFGYFNARVVVKTRKVIAEHENDS